MIRLKILGYIMCIAVATGGGLFIHNYNKPSIDDVVIEENTECNQEDLDYSNGNNSDAVTENDNNSFEENHETQVTDKEDSNNNLEQDNNADIDQNAGSNFDENNDKELNNNQDQNTGISNGNIQNSNSNLQDVNSNNSDSDVFMAQVEQLIFNRVNEERNRNGLNSLSYSDIMQKYARIKSKDMGDNNYFDHRDLSGNYITTNMKNDGLAYSAWAENIAYISGVTDVNALANQFMNNWMNSDGHRKNILSSNYIEIGVGVYKIGNKVYATQEFYR